MEYILRGHCLFGELIPKSGEFVVVTVKVISIECICFLIWIYFSDNLFKVIKSFVIF